MGAVGRVPKVTTRHEIKFNEDNARENVISKARVAKLFARFNRIRDNNAKNKPSAIKVGVVATDNSLTNRDVDYQDLNEDPCGAQTVTEEKTPEES